MKIRMVSVLIFRMEMMVLNIDMIKDYDYIYDVEGQLVLVEVYGFDGLYLVL